MKKTLLLVAVLALTTIAVAQEPAPAPGPMPGPMTRHMGPHHIAPMPPVRGFGGSWWKDSELADKLKLTDQQKQQLEQAFLDYRLKLVDLRASVEREELKLQPLMDADQLNEAQISSQLDTLLAARTKLEKTNAMMNVSMRKVLTADQWKQLRSMREDHSLRRSTARDLRGIERGRSLRRAPGDQPAPPPAAPAPPTPNPGDQ